MKARYAIQFPSGSYFVNVDHPNGGPRTEALRFEHRRAAENYMALSWLTWIRDGGGRVVDLCRGDSSRRAKRDQRISDAADLFSVAARYFLHGAPSPQAIGRTLVTQSQAKRARRLAARRAQ